MVSTLEQMQVSNGTGPDVPDEGNKRPLLASRTRCKYSMETSHIR